MQNINKETEVLNNTIKKLNPTDNYRMLYLTTAEYTFFSSVHGTFSRIYLMLNHKTSFNTFKRIEITQSTFPNHNGIKLDMNNRRKLEFSQICGY